MLIPHTLSGRRCWVKLLLFAELFRLQHWLKAGLPQPIPPLMGWMRSAPPATYVSIAGTSKMRGARISWLPLSRLPRPLLLAVAFGWILMAGSDVVPEMPALCLSGPFGEALAARTEATFAGGDVIGIAVSWVAMLVAMMAPLLSAPLTHVSRQRLSHRRWRAIGLFLLGYTAVWLAAGVVLIPIAVTIQASVYDFAFVPAILGCVIALIWQVTPVKQLCLNACHRLPPLAACGLRADADDVLFGLSHARWCVGTCWALMLCTIMFRGPLHWVVTLAITLFLMFERSRVPQRPRWFAALVPSTPIFTRQTLFSRGAP